MDEFTLIDRFFKTQAVKRDDVRLGIGDDAAITSIDAHSQIVIATDTLCEGTHFPENTEPRALGHRCLAVNLSDLAAMGAEPMWCTLALSLPTTDADWLQSFADGFFALAQEFDVALIGGDTVRGPLSLTVTAHGRVPTDEYVSRTAAGPGQAVFMTGGAGAAPAGLQPLLGEARPTDQALVRRFLYPEPRVREGLALRNLATAMIDVSDGLHADLSRLLAGSGIGATINVEQVPLSDELLAAVGQATGLDMALAGGDDYELCFTVPEDRLGDLQSAAANWECRLSEIGRTDTGAGIRYHQSGTPFVVTPATFEHF
jgi:thiamine-monophosphate kinase